MNQVLQDCRSQFPALQREINGVPVAYLDGAGGTQVPQRVIDAVGHYLAHTNANHHGLYATSRESDELLERAHQAVSDLLGAFDPQTVSFGQNMTSLTFAMSRTLGRTWKPGDEIIVTRLDHDANVTPWVLAARDAGATVRYVDFHPEDCTLDLEDFQSKLSERTRLVAVGCASNSVGSINPVHSICRAAREAGALAYVDAVHYAPHAFIDVESFGCDFLVCSAYKFFGPHVGILWGRRELMDELEAYKVRPAPNDLPGKWMTGTQNHEGIAGTLAAIEYLADMGRQWAEGGTIDRRTALHEAYYVIGEYERHLIQRLLAGLKAINDITSYGIIDSDRADERLPTVSIRHARKSPSALASYLGDLGIFVWHGHYYALQLTETLGLEPDGMVRLSLVHYNTEQDVDRVLDALAAI